MWNSDGNDFCIGSVHIATDVHSEEHTQKRRLKNEVSIRNCIDSEIALTVWGNTWIQAQMGFLNAIALQPGMNEVGAHFLPWKKRTFDS